MKRILFLHYILRQDESELVSQVLSAQIDKPVKGDWCNIVEEDLESVGLSYLTIEDFKQTSKYKMKQIVRKAVKTAALKYLNEAKSGMSKLSNLKYEELKMQDYLVNENMSNRHKQLAFKLRTRMGRFDRNIGEKGPCLTCQSPGTEDSQEHHLTCLKILEMCPDIGIQRVKYMDIFSDEIMKIKQVIEVLDKTIRKREAFLDKEKRNS